MRKCQHSAHLGNLKKQGKADDPTSRFNAVLLGIFAAIAMVLAASEFLA
jgi:hypothetical protein